MNNIYLVDGTYELFRHYFALPSAADNSGQEIAAVRGVLTSIASMLDQGATHVGIATDHVVESFRNDLYPYYKTSAGVPDDLLSQFPLLEEALVSMGVVVWPMEQFEADDALAAAAVKAAAEADVNQVFICTPDKDLAQCVSGDKIVQLDRRKETVRNEAGVLEKFGVSPESIPDYLALVGDTADGYPGLAGWGTKAASSMLAHYKHLEAIPKDPNTWEPPIRGSKKLAETLALHWKDALLFRQLATLRTDAPVFNAVDDLRWRGPTAEFESVCARLKAANLLRKVQKLASNLQPIS